MWTRTCEQLWSITSPKVMKRYCECFLKLAHQRYVCFLPSPSSAPKSGDNLNRKEKVHPHCLLVRRATFSQLWAFPKTTSYFWQDKFWRNCLICFLVQGIFNLEIWRLIACFYCVLTEYKRRELAGKGWLLKLALQLKSCLWNYSARSQVDSSLKWAL